MVLVVRVYFNILMGYVMTIISRFIICNYAIQLSGCDVLIIKLSIYLLVSTCTYKDKTFCIPFSLYFSENSFDYLVERFQRALHQHYEGNNVLPLYTPSEMKKFAEKNAPGLFNLILHSILRDDPRLSDEHRVLQEKRTVVLLHIIAYFR